MPTRSGPAHVNVTAVRTAMPGRPGGPRIDGLERVRSSRIDRPARAGPTGANEVVPTSTTSLPGNVTDGYRGGEAPLPADHPRTARLSARLCVRITGFR